MHVLYYVHENTQRLMLRSSENPLLTSNCSKNREVLELILFTINYTLKTSLRYYFIENLIYLFLYILFLCGGE